MLRKPRRWWAWATSLRQVIDSEFECWVRKNRIVALEARTYPLLEEAERSLGQALIIFTNDHAAQRQNVGCLSPMERGGEDCKTVPTRSTHCQLCPAHCNRDVCRSMDKTWT